MKNKKKTCEEYIASLPDGHSFTVKEVRKHFISIGCKEITESDILNATRSLRGNGVVKLISRQKRGKATYHLYCRAPGQRHEMRALVGSVEVARVSGSQRDRAERDIIGYAMQYREEGEVTIQDRIGGKWRRFAIFSKRKEQGDK